MEVVSYGAWPFVLAAAATVLVFAFVLVYRRSRAARNAETVRTTAARTRTPRGTEPPPPTRSVIVFANQPLAAELSAVAPVPCTVASTPAELTKALSSGRPAALFVEASLLPQLGTVRDLPIVLVVEQASGPAAVVQALLENHKIMHVLARPLLATSFGRVHINRLVTRLGGGAEHDMLDTATIGRMAMLARASHRNQRFDRMQAYFSKAGVSERTIASIYEVAEELVMNALYNAPAEAGHFDHPVSRAEDVELPLDRACEISYGLEGDNAFVRLRDTFGALRHERLMEVLKRCNSEAVGLDESRGGAGLGVWRVFSIATTVTITVIPGRITDILVRIATKGTKRSRQLLATDLFFSPHESPAKLRTDVPTELDQSVALVT